MAGSNGNTSYTKFLFVLANREDDTVGARMRTVGGQIARGFFNDFEVSGKRDVYTPRDDSVSHR